MLSAFAFGKGPVVASGGFRMCGDGWRGCSFWVDGCRGGGCGFCAGGVVSITSTLIAVEGREGGHFGMLGGVSGYLRALRGGCGWRMRRSCWMRVRRRWICGLVRGRGGFRIRRCPRLGGCLLIARRFRLGGSVKMSASEGLQDDVVEPLENKQG